MTLPFDKWWSAVEVECRQLEREEIARLAWEVSARTLTAAIQEKLGGSEDVENSVV